MPKHGEHARCAIEPGHTNHVWIATDEQSQRDVAVICEGYPLVPLATVQAQLQTDLDIFGVAISQVVNGRTTRLDPALITISMREKGVQYPVWSGRATRNAEGTNHAD